MTIDSLLFYAQLLLCLGLGVFAAYRLKRRLQNGITRFLPVKTRVSDEFFNIRSRIGMVLGFILMLLVSTTAYVSVEWLKLKSDNSARLPESYEKTTFELPIMDPPEPPRPPQQEIPEPPSEDTVPIPRVVKLIDHSEKSRAAEDVQPTKTGRYVLQLHAFGKYKNALRQYGHYETLYPQRVIMGYQEGRTPHKIWIGYFQDRSSTLEFKKQEGLPGFPVKVY